ncbi:MAG: SIS domain-containing protein [Pirellulales bacterium]|nr:SIS domain-containing protein [Pirellulales bacterium]
MCDASYARGYLDRLADMLANLDAEAITRAVAWLAEAGREGRTIFSCGNGGSALIASQMVVDMVKQASIGRPTRFKMIGLTDSVGTMLAYGNDVGFETIFVEPLKNFAAAGDVLIAISGSGNSPNVLKAVEYANRIGCRTIGLTTAQGGRLKDLAQLPLVVPADHMGHLEDCFFVMTHLLCYAFIDKAD